MPNTALYFKDRKGTAGANNGQERKLAQYMLYKGYYNKYNAKSLITIVLLGDVQILRLRTQLVTKKSQQSLEPNASAHPHEGQHNNNLF